MLLHKLNLLCQREAYNRLLTSSNCRLFAETATARVKLGRCRTGARRSPTNTALLVQAAARPNTTVAAQLVRKRYLRQHLLRRCLLRRLIRLLLLLQLMVTILGPI